MKFFLIIICIFSWSLIYCQNPNSRKDSLSINNNIFDSLRSNYKADSALIIKNAILEVPVAKVSLQPQIMAEVSLSSTVFKSSKNKFAFSLNKSVTLSQFKPLEDKIKILLPSIINLSNYLPYVGDQDEINSCSAWAVAGMKTIEDNVNSNRLFVDSPKLNSKDFFSPSFLYQLTKENYYPLSDYNQSLSLSDVLKTIENYGIVTLQAFPYYINNSYRKKDVEPYLLEASNHKISNDESVPMNLLDFQQVLNHKSAIAVTLYIDNAFSVNGFEHGWNLNHPYIWDRWGSSMNSNQRTEHSVLCIGYNDYWSAFLMVNSRGLNFGDNGFFWISYRQMFSSAKFAYRIKSKEYDSISSNFLDQIELFNTRTKNLVAQNKLKVELHGRIIDALGLKFEFIEIDSFHLEEPIFHLKIYDSDKRVLRRDIAINNETCRYISTIENKIPYFYYIEESDYIPEKHNFIFPDEPAKLSLIVTKQKLIR